MTTQLTKQTHLYAAAAHVLRIIFTSAQSILSRCANEFPLTHPFPFPLPFQLDNEGNVELRILLISLEHLK